MFICDDVDRGSEEHLSNTFFPFDKQRREEERKRRERELNCNKKRTKRSLILVRTKKNLLPDQTFTPIDTLSVDSSFYGLVFILGTVWLL